ncbi:MAG: Fic family protein [Flavobacteriales bacterium]|nr:Fic family protein [Flavobacteriales bacterium]
MKLLTPKYLPGYRKRLPSRLAAHWTQSTVQEDRDPVALIIEGAVSSSQIEGSKVTMGEYTRAMLVSGGEPRKRNIREVYDLVEAYRTAKRRKITETNLLAVHGRLAKTLLADSNDVGAYRTKGIRVGSFWETVYVGPFATQVKGLMQQLMEEVEDLQARNLSLTEALYYAALLHLRFVQVHPFADGNGRTARLLEKWFLAGAMGRSAWHLRSELYYRLNLSAYYEALKMGRTWPLINLDKCLPFLLQLPNAVMMPPSTGLIEHQ